MTMRNWPVELKEPPPPLNGADRRALAGGAFFFAFAPLAAVAGGLAFAPLQALAALIGAPYGRVRAALAGWAAPAAALMLFALWALVSCLWSPQPGAKQAVKLILGLGFGVVFVAMHAAAGDATRRALALAAALSLGVTIAILAIEAHFDMPMNRLAQPEAISWVLARNPGKGVTALLFLALGVGALGLAAKSNRVRVGLVLGAAAVAHLAFQFDMFANRVAFALAVAALLVGLFAPRFALLAAGGAWAAGVLFAPALYWAVCSGLADVAMAHSWEDRLGVWRSALAVIGEAPIFGVGMDASRAYGAAFTQGGQTFQAIPLHPHSLGLQVWLELGFVGAALLAAAALSAVWIGAQRLPRAAQAAFAALLVLHSVLANVSFGAWQEWWVSLPFITGALIALAARSTTAEVSAK